MTPMTSQVTLAGDALASALEAAAELATSDADMVCALREYGAVHDRVEAAAIRMRLRAGSTSAAWTFVRSTSCIGT